MTKTKLEKKAKYSKSAFVDAAADRKERLLLMTLLDEKKTYSKEEVEKAVKAWKSKAIKEKKKEVKA